MSSHRALLGVVALHRVGDGLSHGSPSIPRESGAVSGSANACPFTGPDESTNAARVVATDWRQRESGVVHGPAVVSERTGLVAPPSAFRELLAGRVEDDFAANVEQCRSGRVVRQEDE